MRAADCKPFVGKTRRVFRQSRQSPPADAGGLYLVVIGFISDPKMAQGLHYLSSIAASFFTAYAFFLLTEVKDGAGHQHNGQLDARRQEKLR